MEIITMKKIQYYLAICTGLLFVSCNNLMDTSSPSIVDREFVFSNPITARAAMVGAYEQWRSTAQNTFFGDGLFYAADASGSDIERHPEKFTNQPGRHYPESFYQNGTYAGQYGLLAYMKDPGDYANLYNTISKVNVLITAIQTADGFNEMLTSVIPTAKGQLYGEAITLRACCYRELIKYFGDVPYQNRSGVAARGLAPRDSIYDVIIGELKQVEPIMYVVGAGVDKTYFSRTAVQGLIGRICLDAAGYQTRRTDLGAAFYKSGIGAALTFEKLGSANNNAEYGRRSDWKDLYATAKTYLKACIDNPGTAVFRSVDPRGTTNGGKPYDNAYQYFFQQMNNLQVADESIYEYQMTQGVGNDSRTYSMGRVSSGSNSHPNSYPCKSYGQARINPAFYYGMFDPKDKRRDVSVSVTGSTGAGVEKLIPFLPGSVANGGGLTLNKWDENRMAKPYVTAQRSSGINGPYLRISEVYLAYAEACAATGDDANALTYLKKIRERSFPSGQANTEAFVTASGGLLKAIIQERGFEFAGEGDRRWTLIRTGLLPEAIRKIKELTRSMLDGLKANGYYTFANGNTISSYVYTKMVDAKTLVGYRLTTECPASKVTDPVLYPGWRGQNDNWEAFTKDATKAIYATSTPATNVAIKGLFTYINPTSAEATALVAAGYTKVNWGADLVTNDDEYYKYLFYDYDYDKAPIYLWPYTPNIISTGGFTNGYGFSQK